MKTVNERGVGKLAIFLANKSLYLNNGAR